MRAKKKNMLMDKTCRLAMFYHCARVFYHCAHVRLRMIARAMHSINMTFAITRLRTMTFAPTLTH
jgi:hypothetical protein